jgi:hypothetical protein
VPLDNLQAHVRGRAPKRPFAKCCKYTVRVYSTDSKVAPLEIDPDIVTVDP